MSLSESYLQYFSKASKYIGLIFILSGLIFYSAADAQIKFKCKGKFTYIDKEYDAGWLGTKPQKPIRMASVTALRTLSSGTTVAMGSGSTDNNGDFDFDCLVPIGTGTITMTAVAISASSVNSANSSIPQISVRVGTSIVTSGTLANFAVQSSSIIKQPDTSTVDFGTTASSQIIFDGLMECNPFNIFDNVLSLWLFLQNGLFQAQPLLGQTLTIDWPATGTFSLGTNSLLAVDDCYDDAVILRQAAMVALRLYSDEDSPGGPHSIGDSDLEPRLAWAEGFSTFFAGAVLNSQGKKGMYADFIPSSAAGDQVGGPAGNRVELEDGFPWNDQLNWLYGAGDEFAVAGALYDLFDSFSSVDSTPNVDDDAFAALLPTVNSMVLPKAFWKVITGPAKQAKDMAANRFWDGWYKLFHTSSGDKSEYTKMLPIFSKWGLNFYDDTLEPNDNKDSATPLAIDGTWHGPYTLYRAGSSKHAPGGKDKDYFVINVVAGQNLTIETTGPQDEFDQVDDPISGNPTLILDGFACHTHGDTVLELYKPNGKLYLQNDDSGSPCRRSLISVTNIPFSGELRIKVSKSKIKAAWKAREYDSYRIRAIS